MQHTEPQKVSFIREIQKKKTLYCSLLNYEGVLHNTASLSFQFHRVLMITLQLVTVKWVRVEYTVRWESVSLCQACLFDLIPL